MEIQKVLDHPEHRITKPSDTRCLVHQLGVKAVKASYRLIVLALENIYQTSHEPENLGLSKALSSHSTIAAMYLLDYILLHVPKHSRALQTKHLDISFISSLVNAILNSLDDAILPLQIGFYSYKMQEKGGLSHLPPKFEHIFVAVITFSPFVLCRHFYYQLVAYCVCFKTICKKSL